MRLPTVSGVAAPDVWTLIISFTAVTALFFHFFRIDVLPMGFYVDESSIGYNAHLISLTGADEHGARWPLFFKAFGEYKNPIYIYALAALYKILGYSEWTTRSLSAFCWAMGTFCLYGLARRLFDDSNTRLYVALSLAFTPWIFSLSRVSFELIALYPLLAVHLLALHHGFDEHSTRWAALAGMAVGLCIYAYSTFRLLTPLYGATALVCYSAPRYRRSQLAFAVGALICTVPYALYAISHLDALTGRFDMLTYVRDPALSFVAKGSLFVAKYTGYFSPSFLAVSGDANRRHHTGFGGELLISTVILLCIAVPTFARDWRNPFRLYLILGLLFAPIPAALTRDHFHSLRAFSMVIFSVLLSAYGFRSLTPRLARAAVAVTGCCAILYLIHYFEIYPPKSAVAFENFGFKQTLDQAVHDTHGRIVLSSEGNQPYINLRFFGSLAGYQVPLVVGSRSDALPGDIYITYAPNSVGESLYRIDVVQRTAVSADRPN
ncbi:MAG TPA: glycosyltransferase family 39 protein [Terriglobales bacterium]|nr:glycosyltransferase family 39 protein [Terriglobales bacterium]